MPKLIGLILILKYNWRPVFLSSLNTKNFHPQVCSTRTSWSRTSRQTTQLQRRTWSPGYSDSFQATRIWWPSGPSQPRAVETTQLLLLRSQVSTPTPTQDHHHQPFPPCRFLCSRVSVGAIMTVLTPAKMSKTSKFIIVRNELRPKL